MDGVMDEPPKGGHGVRIIRDHKGRPVWCLETACVIMETDPAWRGVLAYDEFARQTMLLRPIPGSKVPVSSFRGRPFREDDLTQAQRWFNRNGFPHATKNAADDALQLVAKEILISPVQDYLKALEWDGRARIDFWLRDYCGAKDTPFVREAGRAWLISAVARALKPGVKADCALILEGRQGAKKSSAFCALAGDAWFFDGLKDMHSKDASLALRGKWIIELPELSAMQRSEVEAVKAYLSRREERYRPPYGRGEVVEPRRCVFGGSTNKSDWNRDDTGGRRFWPVAVGKIDVPALERDRDQLWAEAVAAYYVCEPWWLIGEVEAEAAQEVALRGEVEPWTASVLQYVAGKSEANTADILKKIVTDRARMTRAANMRVASVLTRNGWRREGIFTSGPSRGSARYVLDDGE